MADELPRWVDNHCHLDPLDAATSVAEAGQAGVVALITVGTSVAESRTAIAVARQFDNVYATAGVHPHDASDGVGGLEALLSEPGVVAVGESGLDYHYDHSPRAKQREVFAHQVGLANAHGLPLVIHTRLAWEDTFDVLDREGIPNRTVFHCFTGGPDEAAECVERGALLSISGIVTFKSADDVRAAVAKTPLDRLMVETDSPYLAPVPHRGRPNRPALASVVGDAIARQRNVASAALAAQTSANASLFYGISIQ